MAELVLSVSRVKAFLDCKRKYFYLYEQKMPRKQWDHFDMGTLVHGTLENFHQSFRKDGQDQLKRLMKESFAKQRKEMGTVKNTVLIEARDLLADYLKDIEENGIGSEIVTLEEKFEIKLNDRFNLLGFVDRLDLDKDGIYHIKDYKTNKNMKYMEPFQLQAYGLYLLNKFPDIQCFRGSYIILRFNGQALTYDFNIEDVEKIKSQLIEYGDRIMEEKKWAPTQSPLCGWCDFKDTCLNSW